MAPIELCVIVGATITSTCDNDGRAQTVEPPLTVDEGQQVVLPLKVVLMMHDPDEVILPLTSQPTVGVCKVVQDDEEPIELQETLVIVAVELVQPLEDDSVDWLVGGEGFEVGFVVGFDFGFDVL